VTVRIPGVLDIHDFEYIGSFSLPAVPNVPQGDEKVFNPSGITLRTVDGEKRMLLTTGTYQQTLYEVAIPEPGKIINKNSDAVPVAPLRTVFGHLTVDAEATGNGTIWYDQAEGIFYWTNMHGYYTSPTFSFPVLRSARLDNGVITEAKQWFQPDDLGGPPLKTFWGGVTGIPDGFAEEYTGGRKLALGFGGNYAINAMTSWGPSIGAIETKNDGSMDLLPIFYYSIGKPCQRDGNYFFGNGTINVTNPWQGLWTANDIIKSGLFIDLPDKKGYVTFAKQGIYRINYDYGGPTWKETTQVCWYFYNFDDLGKALSGEIPKDELIPSGFSPVEMPNDVKSGVHFQTVAGSCFDPETRRLYLYTLESLEGGWGGYVEPAVHVYQVTGEPDEPGDGNSFFTEKVAVYEANGVVQVSSGTSNLIKEVSMYNLQGTLIYKENAINSVIHTFKPNSAKGIYIVKVVTEKHINNIKLMIHRQ
jgi:hypothetical protein